MSEIFPEKPITSLPEAVAFLGALPVPVGPVPQASEQDRLRAAYVAALDEAHKTHPCPVTGRPYWTGCAHYDEAGHVSGVGSCHSERRADAVLAVRDVELDRLRAQVATLLEERRTTNESVSKADEALRVQRDRIAELEHTVQGMAEGLNGHDCPPPGETPMQAVTRFAVRLMEAERLLAEDGCSCPPAVHPHQVGCPLDLPAPGSADVEFAVQYPDGQTVMAETASQDRRKAEASLRAHRELDPVMWRDCRIVQRSTPDGPWVEAAPDAVTRSFTPVAALREVLDGEHYAQVHHSYRVPHDLPLGCVLTDAQVEQLGNPYLGGGA